LVVEAEVFAPAGADRVIGPIEVVGAEVLMRSRPAHDQAAHVERFVALRVRPPE
jgi:hypothetical protein